LLLALRLTIVASATHLVESLEEIEGRFAIIHIQAILDLIVFGEVVGRNRLLHIEGGFVLGGEGEEGKLRRS
jgi:L-asparagine transporter-like permease